jgi:hypothetical protein
LICSKIYTSETHRSQTLADMKNMKKEDTSLRLSLYFKANMSQTDLKKAKLRVF